MPDRARPASNGFQRKNEPGCVDSLTEIEETLRDFREARDWGQFHTPKNLAISVAIEAGELLEHFQWRSDAEIDERIRAEDVRLREEIADVAIYLIQLADVTGVSLTDAVKAKIERNSTHYPVALSKGSSAKQPGRNPTTRSDRAA